MKVHQLVNLTCQPTVYTSG